ncbi:DUF342 domain-containing protein [Agaribacter flavus]|uniref:DUF342 domain-containing protein n=1 Tax=Agaribacter flavus TaxID=1902781 RepID=A0ABV7FPA0_9ALTE
MNGVALSFSEEHSTVLATVSPNECDASLEADLLKKFIQKSEFGHYFIKEDAVNSLVANAKKASGEGKVEAFTCPVAELKDAEIKVKISEDEMEASMTVIGAFGGAIPKLANFHQALADKGIVRGWSVKIINKLVEQIKSLQPGRTHKEIIAKGLPPRKGKNSRVRPLVENALERVLQPKKAEGNKVDMRDLGEIICVKQGDTIAEILPPSQGRSGFTVTNKKIQAERGDECEIKLGENTELSTQNKQLIIASIDGLPKFLEGVMTVDNTFISKGVNVKTGNVNFKGSVIVNGDVTENMKIFASGDIMINGFVESAIIESEGDIIITQGVMGKPDVDDCRLIAKGEVALQHAQGVYIESKGAVRVMKQIAHSEIRCMDNIYVGRGEQPQGSIFGCQIVSFGYIEAGNVGAVSGSKLEVDFTEGYDKITRRLEGLREMRKDLASTNADHELQYAQFKNKEYTPEVQEKVDTLKQALEEERALLQWLQGVEQENVENLANYQKNAKIISRSHLYPGVSVKLSKLLYVTDKELSDVCLCLREHEWKVVKFKG